MMGFDDFGLSVLASMFANKIDEVFFRPSTKLKVEQEEHKAITDIEFDSEPERLRTRRFKTFDPWTDLTKILAAVQEPLIFILIEDEPSTYYRLPSMVLESKLTGEWFVFSRGRMSFEGDGGGIRNSRDILDEVKKINAAIGVWVVPQELLNDLDNGYELWPAVRPQAVPLLAIITREHSWAEIEENVRKYVRSSQ